MSAMPDLRIPLGRHARRAFFTIVLLGVIALIAVRFWVIPGFSDQPRPSVAEVLDDSLGDILATVVSATVLSGIFYFYVRPTKKRAELDVVHPKDIGPNLTSALRTARSWHYDGSTGRWNRSKMLPALAEAARSTSSLRSCRLLIIDPTNERLCEKYGEYRRGVRTGDSGDWSVGGVRADLCATIVISALFQTREPLLNVEVFLKPLSPVYRVDASDQRVMLTREDPMEPGLECRAETHFFDAFMQGVNFNADQARQIKLWKGMPREGPVSAEDVRACLAEADFDFPELQQDDFIGKVLAKVNEPKSPYGS